MTTKGLFVSLAYHQISFQSPNHLHSSKTSGRCPINIRPIGVPQESFKSISHGEFRHNALTEPYLTASHRTDLVVELLSQPASFQLTFPVFTCCQPSCASTTQPLRFCMPSQAPVTSISYCSKPSGSVPCSVVKPDSMSRDLITACRTASINLRLLYFLLATQVRPSFRQSLKNVDASSAIRLHSACSCVN